MKKKRTKWTEEKAREFIEYYSSHTAKETADKYQMPIGSVTSIYSRLTKKYNIPVENKSIKWVEEKARELIEYYTNHTVEETSIKFQIAPQSVSSLIRHLSKRYHISVENKSIKWTEEKARELIEYYTNHTVEETAEKYQTTPHYIGTMVSILSKKYNIPFVKKKAGRKIKWTEEKAKELIEYYSSHTAKETADKYQLAFNSAGQIVRRLSKKYNIPVEKK